VGYLSNFRFTGSQLTARGVFVDKIRMLSDFVRANRADKMSDVDTRLYYELFDFWDVAAEDPSAYPDSRRCAEALPVP
jgi:hypothetical protein